MAEFSGAEAERLKAEIASPPDAASCRRSRQNAPSAGRAPIATSADEAEWTKS